MRVILSRTLSVVLMCVGLALAPAGVSAQSSLSDAQQQQLVELIEEGKQAYDRGEFESSLSLFRQAYDIYQHPDIVYRIALCYERLGEDQEAIKHYRQFLAEAPDAPERPRIEKTIEVIEARIAKSEIQITTNPPGAAVFVDDEANGVAGYTPTVLAVKPGNYKLLVRKDGFDTVNELVTVGAGQSVQVRYQLDPVGTEESPVVRDRRPTRGTAPSVKFLTLTAIGAGAGITSIVFFGLHGERRAKLAELDELDRQELSRNRHNEVRRQRNINLAVAVSSAAVSAFAFIWAYGTWVADRSAAQQAGLSAGWDDGPIITYSLRF